MTDTTPARQRQVQALRAAATRRTNNAVQAAEHGIRVLIKDHGRISFAAVARAGGVSTKFLHSHPELSTRIRYLAQQQCGQANTTDEQPSPGESSIVVVLRNKIREQQQQHQQELARLRAQIREQERQIAILYGQLQR